jgi:hypothetical protein
MYGRVSAILELLDGDFECGGPLECGGVQLRQQLGQLAHGDVVADVEGDGQAGARCTSHLVSATA